MSNISLLRFPSVVRMGNQCISTFLSGDLEMIHARKIMLVTDPGIVKAGLAEIVQNVLEAKHIRYCLFSDVEQEPSIETVKTCIAYAKEEKCDTFIGLGGGSAMDVCKAVALCVADNVDIDSLFGMETIKRPGLHKVLIPTTSGSGSESSPSIVLSDHHNNTKKAIWSRYVLADIVYLDSDMTIGMPKSVTGGSGVDALCHAIEAYMATNSNFVTDNFALTALNQIGKHLREVYQNGKNREARLGMMGASFLAGMAFGGSGLGCVHALAYPFTTLFGYPHGNAQGMSMPNVLRFNKLGHEERFAQIARSLNLIDVSAMDAKDAAEAGIDAIEQLINDVGISTKLRDYPGITPDRFLEMGKIAIESNGRLVNTNPRPMTVEQAVRIYQQSY